MSQSIADVIKHFASENPVIPENYKNMHLRQIAMIVADIRENEDPSFTVTMENYQDLVIKTLTTPNLRERLADSNPKRQKSRIEKEILGSLYPEVLSDPPRVKAVFLEGEEAYE